MLNDRNTNTDSNDNDLVDHITVGWEIDRDGESDGEGLRTKEKKTRDEERFGEKQAEKIFRSHCIAHDVAKEKELEMTLK